MERDIIKEFIRFMIDISKDYYEIIYLRRCNCLV